MPSPGKLYQGGRKLIHNNEKNSDRTRENLMNDIKTETHNFLPSLTQTEKIVLSSRFFELPKKSITVGAEILDNGEESRGKLFNNALANLSDIISTVAKDGVLYREYQENNSD